MPIPIIDLEEVKADPYDRDRRWIKYQGVFVHRVDGPVHSPGYPHRVLSGRPGALLCAEPIIESWRGSEWTGTGTWESGQPFGPVLSIGAIVQLRFPFCGNGRVPFFMFRIVRRRGADPMLRPID